MIYIKFFQRLSLIFMVLFLVGCNNVTSEGANKEKDNEVKFTNSVEELLQVNGIEYNKILHKIELENGLIVLFNTYLKGDNEGKQLKVAFIKNEKGNLTLSKVENNVTGFNKNVVFEDVVLPDIFNEGNGESNIVFGVINNSNIKDINVRLNSGSLEDGSFIEAEIVKTDWKNIFYKIRGKQERTQVISVGKNGEVIDNQG